MRLKDSFFRRILLKYRILNKSDDRMISIEIPLLRNKIFLWQCVGKRILLTNQELAIFLRVECFFAPVLSRRSGNIFQMNVPHSSEQSHPTRAQTMSSVRLNFHATNGYALT